MLIAAAIGLQSGLANATARIAKVVQGAPQQTPRGNTLTVKLKVRERVAHPKTPRYKQNSTLAVEYVDHQNVFGGKKTLALGGDVKTIAETWYHSRLWGNGGGIPSSNPYTPVLKDPLETPTQGPLVRGEDGVYRGTIRHQTTGIFNWGGRVITGVGLAIGDGDTWDSMGFRGNTHVSFTR